MWQMKLQLVTKDERWNLFTWLVFLLLLAAYFVALGLLATPIGLTEWWLGMLGMGPGAVGEATEMNLRPHTKANVTVTVALFLCFLFVVPIIVALLPTLATLLYLMDHAEKRRQRQRNP